MCASHARAPVDRAGVDRAGRVDCIDRTDRIDRDAAANPRGIFARRRALSTMSASRIEAALDGSIACGASWSATAAAGDNMQGLVVGDLRIEALEVPAPAAIRLVWKGKSNHRHPHEALAPYFREVLATAGDRKLAIELHFEKLEHFNSSTITSIIQLIQETRARAIRLVLVYDQALKWQKLSFDALRVFAKDELLELRAA
jgi:hypothetical protein